MTPADRLAQLIHDARDLAAYVSDGPMRNQPTVAQMGALLAQLADAVEQRVASPTDPPCPSCGKPMLDDDGQWFCANNHRAVYLAEGAGPTDPDLRAAPPEFTDAELWRIVQQARDPVKPSNVLAEVRAAIERVWRARVTASPGETPT